MARYVKDPAVSREHVIVRSIERDVYLWLNYLSPLLLSLYWSVGNQGLGPLRGKLLLISIVKIKERRKVLP